MQESQTTYPIIIINQNSKDEVAQSLIKPESKEFEEDKFLLSTIALEENLWDKVKGKNLTQAKAANAPTLATIKKYQGEITAYLYIIEMLLWLRKNTKVDTNIPESFNDSNKDIFYEICDTIYMAGSNFKITYLKLFAKYLKSGKYGPDFNRLDDTTIAHKMREYWKDRCKVKVRSQSERDESKSSRTAIFAPKEIIDMGNQLGERLRIDREAKANKRIKESKEFWEKQEIERVQNNQA